MTKWQPIETAPHGEDVLMYFPEDDGGAFMDVFDGEVLAAPDGFMIGGVEPTHWASLPPGPHDKKERERADPNR